MAVKTSIAWVVIVVVLVVFVLTGSTFVALSSLIVVGERSILFPFTSQTFLHLPYGRTADILADIDLINYYSRYPIISTYLILVSAQVLNFFD